MLKLSSVVRPLILKGGSGAILEVVEVNDKLKVKKSISGCKLKASKLSKQYEWLAERNHLEHIVKVSDLYHEKDYCSYYLEYHPEHVSLDDYLHAASPTEVKSTLKSVIDFTVENIHGVASNVKSQDLFLFYLKTKLHDKIMECSGLSHSFQRLLSHNEIVINGAPYQNFTSCYLRLINSQKVLKRNATFKQCQIHGDLTFENILINPLDKSFVIIDPNLDNAISTPGIDFAKLNQSGLSRYENMKRIQKVSQVKNQINFDETAIQPGSIGETLTNLLELNLSESVFNNLSLYEAIHFARLLPYKLELSPHNFYAFYARMIVLLNQYLQQSES